MKTQFILFITMMMSSPHLFAQNVDVTIATSNVASVIEAGEYVLLSWSAKSRDNTTVPENKIKFFLSQDDQLSRDDLYLGGALVPKLEEGKEGQLNYKWVRIPSNISGDYKLLFSIDADNEIEELSESDNVKAETIEVLAKLKSDLVIESTDLPLIGIEGEQLPLGWAIRNQGEIASSQTYLTVYLSETPEITDSSVKILGVNVGVINAGQRIVDRATVTIPSDTRVDGGVIGKRYIVFDVDSNQEDVEYNEANNIDFKRINISGSVDLVSTGIKAYGSIDYYAPHTRGVLYNVKFKVNNLGNGNSEAGSTVKCYLSRDSQLDANDELIRTITDIPTLDANGGAYEVEFSDRWNKYIPGPDGSTSLEDKLRELLNYNVIVVVDSEEVITEVDETNNVDFKRIEIKGTPDLISTIQTAYGSIGYYAPHAKDVLYKVELSVKNQGNGDSDSSTVKCYLSIDDQLDANDELIYTTNVPALNSNGDSYEFNFSDRWNKQFSGGPDGLVSLENKLRELLNYKIITVVDVENTVSESNEMNNETNKNLTIEPSQIGARTLTTEKTTTAFPVPVTNVLNVTVVHDTELTIYNTSNGSAVISKTYSKSGTYQIDVTSLKSGGFVLKDNRGKKINFIKR